jgi:hypothetical protein
MKFSRLFILIALTVEPLASIACEPMGPSVAYAKEATFAAIGREVGQRTLSYPHPLQLIVRVTVGETLFGEPIAQVDAVSPCALPIRPHEEVVVARIHGNLVAFPADLYEQSFRLAFRKGR